MADDKKKGPRQRAAAIDTTIIGEERIKALRAQAAKKVEAERVKAAEAQLLEQFEKEERQQGGLDEQMVDITIDLAPHAAEIRLDGVVYFQGHRYTVRQSVAEVMSEIMAAGWNHQSIIDGKSENFYRQSRGQGVTPGGVVGGMSNILRA